MIFFTSEIGYIVFISHVATEICESDYFLRARACGIIKFAKLVDETVREAYYIYVFVYRETLEY